MGDPLMRQRELIKKQVFPMLAEPIRYSPILDGRETAGKPFRRVAEMRVNQGQELVIAGYTLSPKNFDALVIGYYESDRLMYAARTRNGFTPASRAELFNKIKPLEIKECPFANLPEKKAGLWGAGLTAVKMVECRWLRPQRVAV